MLSRRDYIRLARALKQADKSASNEAIKSGVYLAFSWINEELWADNIKFDKEKFFEAVYGK